MDKPMTLREFIEKCNALPEEQKDLPLYTEIDTDKENFYTATGEIVPGMFVSTNWRHGSAYTKKYADESWEDDERDLEHGPFKVNALLIC